MPYETENNLEQAETIGTEPMIHEQEVLSEENAGRVEKFITTSQDQLAYYQLVRDSEKKSVKLNPKYNTYVELIVLLCLLLLKCRE